MLALPLQECPPFVPSPQNAKPTKHNLLADPPTTTKVKSKDKKNLNNMATNPVHEIEARKEKMATTQVNVDEYVSRKNASHQKSIPPSLSMMLHQKMPL